MQHAERRRSPGVIRRILSAAKRPAIKSWTAAAALVVGLMGGAVGFAPAAYAATSCGGPVYHPVVAHIYGYSVSETYVQYCPIWKSNTPVYDGSSAIVGYLTYSGDSNWFICHLPDVGGYSAYGYTTTDWAMTEADNGRWGWVPAVYFSGVQNYWYGLRTCTSEDVPTLTTFAN